MGNIVLFFVIVFLGAVGLYGVYLICEAPLEDDSLSPYEKRKQIVVTQNHKDVA